MYTFTFADAYVGNNLAPGSDVDLGVQEGCRSKRENSEDTKSRPIDLDEKAIITITTLWPPALPPASPKC